MDELKQELQRALEEYQSAMGAIDLMLQGMKVKLNEKAKRIDLLFRKLDAIERSQKEYKDAQSGE